MATKAVGKKAGGPAPKPKIERKYSEVQLGEYLIGSQVWIRDPEREELYALAKVTAISGTSLTVEVEGAGTKTVEQSECLNANVGITAETCNDLSKIPHANEAAALQIIKERYVRDMIYTYAGRLLIAMNPFKAIPGLYEPGTLTRYQNCDTSRGFPTDVPPHTYALAQCAMDLMRLTKENQSCVVSGESGAGKTETARQLMQYFASDKSGAGGSTVQDIILGANPVLEAVGNAKTLRNNNSSRFGRFVKLEVAPTGGIHGGLINNYMLELSRIEFQGQGERNYHIFYQMIKGLSADEKKQCGLKGLEEYEFLNKSGCYEVETVNDLKEFADVRKQLELLFTKEEQLAYFQVLSAVLMCGNIKFTNVQAMGTDKAGKLQDETDFDQVVSLLGVDKAALLEAITVNVVEVRGNIIKSPLSAEQASVMCRSMAKEVYSVFFDFIVESVNDKIKFDHENKVWIGILDIYGFEFFQLNSYEQFLINYANERLQQFFIQQVFQAEKAEYEAEGIDHSMIVYSDNASVLEVFDKPKAGIFGFLEEQCLIQTGSSESFTAACHKSIKNPNYEIPKGDSRITFRIIHTAAPVLYTATEFVPKNKMRLPNELIAVFKAATNLAMKKAFVNVEIPDSKNMKGKFVGSKFQKSMNNLMNTLKSSRAHFCRCIKPNQVKKPQVFETESTLGQLISLSVLEAVGIIHRGFAYRASFADFVNDNSILLRVLGAKLEGGDDKTATTTMLERLGVPKQEYQLGSSKVFLRKAGWLVIDQYFRTVMANLKPLIIRLQSIYRASKARSQYVQFASRVVRIQSLMRRYDIRKTQFKKLELAKTFLGAIYTMKLCLTAAITRRAKMGRLLDQARRITYAGVTGLRWKRTAHRRKEDHAARVIQGLLKIVRAKRTLAELKEQRRINAFATKIQAAWRGYVSRLRLALMKYLTPYAIVIQRHWKGYRVRHGAFYAKHAKILDKVNTGIREDQARLVIQNAARTFLVLQRLQHVTQAAYTMQKFLLPKLLRLHVSRAHEAIVRIQAWWRGNRVRRILQEEKLKCILSREKERASRKMLRFTAVDAVPQVLADRKTLRECAVAMELMNVKERLGLCSIGLQLVHVTASIEGAEVYPTEWAEGIRRLLAFNGEASLSHIAVGAFHTVLVSGAGFVYSYGLNDRMQLGCPEEGAGVPLPRHPIRGLMQPLRVQEVFCGVDHSVLLTEQGSVFAWGSNKYVGGYHNAALDEMGRIYMWGRGDHIFIKGVISDVPLPLWISLPELCEGPLPISVHCGLGMTFLIFMDGTLKSFGRAPNGQLGLGKNSRSERIPQRVSIPGHVQQLSVGSNMTVALNTSGEVFQWGTFLLWDEVEEVCIKAQTFEPMPVDLIRAGLSASVLSVGVGWWEAVVLSADGKLWAWNFFERANKETIAPALYQYELAEKRTARKLHVVSSPLLCAVLAQFASPKEEAEARKALGAPPRVMCSRKNDYPDFEKQGLIREE
ncbi:myosin h [Cyclospora cayetanensis]|uniref:Myosin h n=1 Tax=Cyclospora cayetanensis TaxID=88456 RepID=A0A1D3CZF5_9EIME|nr:myosin h [Cyclospora cayetanensis]